MSRTPSTTELALLNALEPEAKAAWLDDILTMQQAIAASQAITNRRQVNVMADQATITVRSLPAETQGNLPPIVRDRYDPDYNIP